MTGEAKRRREARDLAVLRARWAADSLYCVFRGDASGDCWYGNRCICHPDNCVPLREGRLVPMREVKP